MGDVPSDGPMVGAPDKFMGIIQQTIDDDMLAHSTIDPSSATDQYGRSYQTYRLGKYHLPNDALEQDRLDTMHGIYCLALGGLYLAPIHKPRFVLDLGTGTGIWAMDFAQANPESVVLGTDLSLIQPAHYPPNCSWMQHNAEEKWTSFPAHDFIHIRSLAGCFDNDMSVLAKCYRNLAPGGYIELQDILYDAHSYDGTHEGTSLQRFNRTLWVGLRNLGRDMWVPTRYKYMLVAAGFQDVQERILMVPCNGWPGDAHAKKMGRLQRYSMEKGLQAMHRLLMVAGMSDADAVELENRTLMDLNNRDTHALFPLYFVYARKPLETLRLSPPVQQQSGSAVGGMPFQSSSSSLGTRPPVVPPPYYPTDTNLPKTEPPVGPPPYYTNNQPSDYQAFSVPVPDWTTYHGASFPTDTYVTSPSQATPGLSTFGVTPSSTGPGGNPYPSGSSR